MNVPTIVVSILLSAAAEPPPVNCTADAKPRHPETEAVHETLQRKAAEGVNTVFLLRHGEDILLHCAYGYRDREAAEALSVEHGFTVGSIVKPINAVGILKLEAAGKLDTGDPISKYFADTPPDKSAITIDQLLRHRSGLPDIFGGDFVVVGREWVLQKALKAELLFEPGSEERYSNAGYSLLAMIIEDVSGRPFETYIREEVLKPGGADRIGYVQPGWVNQDLAVGYRADGTRWGTLLDYPWAEDGPSWNLRGNGGMLGTVIELSDWYRALGQGRIIQGDALKKFFDIDAGASRSLGGTAMAHAGGNGIFNSLQISWVDHDYHMTAFTSTGPQQAEAAWDEISDDVIQLGRRLIEAGEGR